MVTSGAFLGLPGFVFAWEKEEGDKPDRAIVGSGFVTEDNPAPAKP